MVVERIGYGGFSGDKPFSLFAVLADGRIVSAYMLDIGGIKTSSNAVYNFCRQNGYGQSYFAKIR